MRKLLIVILVMFSAIELSAQVRFWDGSTPDKTVTIGPRLGLNISTVGGSGVDGVDPKAGLFVGGEVDFNIVRSFSINTGLFFTGKGCKTSVTAGVDDMLFDVDERVTANFLQLPIYASYRLNFTEDTQLQVFFGPYFECGVYGKYTVQLSDAGWENDTSTDIFNDELGFHRFQVGIGAGVAVTWSNFYLGVQGQFGATEIAKDADARWNTCTIALGYNF